MPEIDPRCARDVPWRAASSEQHTELILHLRLRPIARLLDPPEVWTPVSFQYCSLASFSRLGALLRRCADDVLRAKALELVDPGQRERVGWRLSSRCAGVDGVSSRLWL